MTAKRELLFSLGPKDFEVQTFRSGGKGGQNQNKVETGVRIIHPASGARGESREHASQHANKKAAFERMAATKVFRDWHKLETARRLGNLAKIEEIVAGMMAPGHLRVEGKQDGRWVPLEGTVEGQ